MTLIFMRHGQADHNINFRLNESDHIASNLTDNGKREVLKNAKALKETIKAIDVIYCSSILRCRQTAKIVEKYFDAKIPIKTDKRLNELRTGFDNRMPLVWLIRLFFSRNRLNKKFKAGQSITEVSNGIGEFYQEIIKKHPNGNILIISHLYIFQIFCHHLYHKKLLLPWRPNTMRLKTAQWHLFRT